MTKLQEFYVKGDIDARLGAIFTDNLEREEIVEDVLNAVIADIDETADWSNLDSDEVVTDDISIALQRVLYKKIVGE